MKKQFYLFSIAAFLLSLFLAVNVAFAQESTNTSSNTNTSLEAENQDITASDLGISDPKILPDSPWYGLKKFWEGIKDAFTFNPIVKAENSLNRASERLIEIQKLVDEGKIKDADKVIGQYQKRVDQIKERIAKLTDVQSDKAEKFLDKFAEYQIKHRLILEKIESSSATPEEIKIAKEKSLSVLSDALSKTDNEKLQARLEKAIAKIEGSDLKQFKNLEVLKALEDKVPDSAKPAILKAQANALKRLKEDIDKLPAESRPDKIDKFLEQIRGDKSKYLEVLDELIANDNLSPELVARLQAIKLKIQERINNKNEVEQEDDNGDRSDCACAKIYIPVCGSDGETYGNVCEAQCENVTVAYPGKCKDDDNSNDNSNANDNDNKNENRNENSAQENGR